MKPSFLRLSILLLFVSILLPGYSLTPVDFVYFDNNWNGAQGRNEWLRTGICIDALCFPLREDFRGPGTGKLPGNGGGDEKFLNFFVIWVGET